MIRYLKNEEKVKIRPLYRECFNDDKQYTDFYFEKRLPENRVVVKEDEKSGIVSAVHLIPKTINTGVAKVNISYIYGVGTGKAYRKKGYMGELFKKILRGMADEKEPFTYLIPSNEENAFIYKKMGFQFVMDKQKIKPESRSRKASHSLILRKADSSDMLRLSFFAKAFVAGTGKISIEKDLNYFRHIKELVDAEQGKIEIYVKNRVILGYRIWVGDEILEEALDSNISNMTRLEKEKYPYAMARIINIKSALAILPIKEFKPFCVRISDPIIEENNGCFVISQTNGKANVASPDENNTGFCPDFDVTIGELTAHIFGYKIIEGLPQILEADSFWINDYV